MKLSIRSRVVKNYEVQVAAPLLVEPDPLVFEKLTNHLSILTAREEMTPPGPTGLAGAEGQESARPESETQISMLWTQAEAEANAKAEGMINGAEEKAKAIISEAERQAEEILSAAKREEAAILAAVQAEEQLIRERVSENVRAEVLPQVEAEGYEAGHQQGYAEAEKLIDEARKLLGLAQTALAAELKKVDGLLVTLALKIAGRIVRATLAVSPQKLLDTIRALTLLPQEREGWILHISPADAHWLEALPPEWQLLCQIVPDTVLAAGDCFLECSEGILDASLEAQLAKLEQSLREELLGGGLE